MIYAGLLQVAVGSGLPGGPHHAVSLDVLLGLGTGLLITISVAVLLVKLGVIKFCGEPTSAPCLLDKCTEHMAEKERSLANQRSIESLWQEVGSLRSAFEGRSDTIDEKLSALILGLVQANVIEVPNNILGKFHRKTP